MPLRRRLPIVREFFTPDEIPVGFAGPMTTPVAHAIAGNLGSPSKMPGYTYGISAQQCQTGGKLRQVRGSVCSACYAMTDWYRSWRPLLEGHRRRLAGLRHPRWADAMVQLIERACRAPEDYFRWHDSGDLQGLWHLENIAQVCERTPQVHHWLPTREYDMVVAYASVLPGIDRLHGVLSARVCGSWMGRGRWSAERWRRATTSAESAGRVGIPELPA